MTARHRPLTNRATVSFVPIAKATEVYSRYVMYLFVYRVGLSHSSTHLYTTKQPSESHYNTVLQSVLIRKEREVVTNLRNSTLLKRFRLIMECKTDNNFLYIQ